MSIISIRRSGNNFYAKFHPTKEDFFANFPPVVTNYYTHSGGPLDIGVMDDDQVVAVQASAYTVNTTYDLVL